MNIAAFLEAMELKMPFSSLFVSFLSDDFK